MTSMMMKTLLLLVVLLNCLFNTGLTTEVPDYVVPLASGRFFFAEPFESQYDFKDRWVVSQAKKEGVDEDIALYDGEWAVEGAKQKGMDGDLGLVLKTKAKHHAISAQLDESYHFSDKPFIIQYDVKFQNDHDCGGAYVKLLTDQPNLSLNQFYDKTPYTIMFGPDKCGQDFKLHFIFRHRNPLTFDFEEKHTDATSVADDIKTLFKDKKTHLFTLVLRPDNTFEVSVDRKVVKTGSLLTDVTPPINPPEEIDDPSEKRPEEWDEKKRIPDPEAEKPENWDEDAPKEIDDDSALKPVGWLDDEPQYIPDPNAEMPDDWDEEMDGEWEAPLINNPLCTDGCGIWFRPKITNPAYKGKWRSPLIDNPNYMGEWKPTRISNPSFFEDLHPFKMTSIKAVGLELWSMSNDIMFDNFLITDDETVAYNYASDTWQQKRVAEGVGEPSPDSVVDALVNATADKPWLWFLYAAAVILPVVGLFYWLCSSPKKSTTAARRKKTDEPTPDHDNGAEADDEGVECPGDEVDDDDEDEEVEGAKEVDDEVAVEGADDGEKEEAAVVEDEDDGNVEVEVHQGSGDDDKTATTTATTTKRSDLEEPQKTSSDEAKNSEEKDSPYQRPKRRTRKD